MGRKRARRSRREVAQTRGQKSVRKRYSPEAPLHLLEAVGRRRIDYGAKERSPGEGEGGSA